VTEKPAVGPSGRIPKATKDVKVRFFIHSRYPCKLYQRFPGTLEATAYLFTRILPTCFDRALSSAGSTFMLTYCASKFQVAIKIPKLPLHASHVALPK
jgi:hypothetical protein